MKQLVIDRKTWYRGQQGGSLLRRKQDDKMCCLGFYALSCGLSVEDITGMGSFAQLDLRMPTVPKECGWLLEDASPETGCSESSRDGYELMSVNDDSTIAEKDRETKLIELFREQNIEVTFVD